MLRLHLSICWHESLYKVCHGHFGFFEQPLTDLSGREGPLGLGAHYLNEFLLSHFATNAENVVKQRIFLVINTSDLRKCCAEFFAHLFVVKDGHTASVWGDCSRVEQLGSNRLPVFVVAADVCLRIRFFVLEQFKEDVGLGCWLFFIVAVEQSQANQTLVVHAPSWHVLEWICLSQIRG